MREVLRVRTIQQAMVGLTLGCVGGGQSQGSIGAGPGREVGEMGEA